MRKYGNFHLMYLHAHVLTDISSEDVLDLFLLESSLDNELIITIYRTTATKHQIILDEVFVKALI